MKALNNLKQKALLLSLFFTISCTKTDGCKSVGQHYGNFYVTGTFIYSDKPFGIHLYSKNPYNPNYSSMESNEILFADAILVLDSIKPNCLVEYFDTIGFNKKDIPADWRKECVRHCAAAVHPLHGYNTNAFELICIE